MRGWIQTAAFVRKESFEILRQPRLLIPLVIGPFLIMFLFGIGYRNEGRNLRTLYVISPGDPIRKEIEKFAPNIGPQLKFEGITSDLTLAKRELQQRKVDLLIIAPSDAYDTISHNERATFTLAHSEVDPYQADYIRFTGELYTDKLNNILLKQSADQWKSQLGTLKTDLQNLNADSQRLRFTLEKGNEIVVNELQNKIQKHAEAVEAQLLDQYQGVDDWVDPDEPVHVDQVRSLGDKLLDFHTLVDSLDDDEQKQTRADDIQKALTLEQNITDIT